MAKRRGSYLSLDFPTPQCYNQSMDAKELVILLQCFQGNLPDSDAFDELVHLEERGLIRMKGDQWGVTRDGLKLIRVLLDMGDLAMGGA